MWLEDIIYGAITSGGPTVLLLNVTLLACICCLSFLLWTSYLNNPPLVPHVAVLLVLAFSLLASTNWFLSEVGTVSAEQQRRQLFGEESSEHTPLAGSTPSAAASDKDGGVIDGGKKQQ